VRPVRLQSVSRLDWGSSAAGFSLVVVAVAALGSQCVGRAADNTSTASASPVRFRKQVLTDKYYCDGITVGDINRDGRTDIVAGPFWYEGPGFTHRHEFYTANVFPTEPSPTESLYNFGYDFT